MVLLFCYCTLYTDTTCGYWIKQYETTHVFLNIISYYWPQNRRSARATQTLVGTLLKGYRSVRLCVLHLPGHSVYKQLNGSSSRMRQNKVMINYYFIRGLQKNPWSDKETKRWTRDGELSTFSAAFNYLINISFNSWDVVFISCENERITVGKGKGVHLKTIIFFKTKQSWTTLGLPSLFSFLSPYPGLNCHYHFHLFHRQRLLLTPSPPLIASISAIVTILSVCPPRFCPADGFDFADYPCYLCYCYSGLLRCHCPLLVFASPVGTVPIIAARTKTTVFVLNTLRDNTRRIFWRCVRAIHMINC